MGLCRKLKLLDLDDLFAYKTPRMVVIRDRKLGISRWLLLLGIFAYVVIYEVIVQRGYLKTDDPLAFTRISVLAHGDRNPRDFQYCCHSSGCEQPGFDAQRGRLECVGWDHYNTIMPPAEEFSAFVTTRATVTTYSPVDEECLLNASAVCGELTVASKKAYYVAGIDEMTILLRHAVYGRWNNLVFTSTRDMSEALLIGSNGDTLMNFCHPDGLPSDAKCTDGNPMQHRYGDIITVDTLLRAGGLEGDVGKRLDTKNPDSNDTLRYDGVVLLVAISYEGTGKDRGSVSYKYHVRHVEGAEHKYEEVRDMYRPHPTDPAKHMVQRVVWNRHGVRIVVIGAGMLGVFSFTEMMKTLVTGLGLLTISKVVTDYIIMRLLPRAPEYRRYKRVYTIDFSNLDKNHYRILKKGSKEITRGGGRLLTDDAFVYGELSDSEEELVVEERKRYKELQERENITNPLAHPSSPDVDVEI